MRTQLLCTFTNINDLNEIKIAEPLLKTFK